MIMLGVQVFFVIQTEVDGWLDQGENTVLAESTGCSMLKTSWRKRMRFFFGRGRLRSC